MNEPKRFSFPAKDYAKYRPKYPAELFEFLSSICCEHNKAWDCACGNGQAALGLAPYFDEIIATDISEEQIARSIPNEKIKFYQASAENSGLPSHSIDLITAATSIHWFNKQKFFDEAERILKREGILAVWNYTNMTTINHRIDAVIDYLNDKILGDKDYWPEEAYNLFKEGYNFEFPFKIVPVPEMTMEHTWTLDEMIKYLHTWSGVNVYIKKNNSDPIDLIYEDLKAAWGDENIKRKIIWKLLFAARRV